MTMKRRTFQKTPRLWRAVAIVSVALLVVVPGAGMAGADPAVMPGAGLGGTDLRGMVDPELLAWMSATEQRVLQERQQGQELQRQKQDLETKIQANNQEATSIEQQVSAWNTKMAALNQQMDALERRISAHNAEPHRFQLPAQEAQSEAYQAEADELNSEKRQLQSQQNELDSEKSAISTEEDRIQSAATQLDNQKQQINQQITTYNDEVSQLKGQVQQMLQRLAAALEALAAAQQARATDSTPWVQVAGGDQAHLPDTAQNDGRAGNDGGDPSSPKAAGDALDRYGKQNGVRVFKQPTRVWLTPNTVSRLTPDAAAGLSPYRTYDGLVPNSSHTYTALKVVNAGAATDPFEQVIDQGRQGYVLNGGKTLVITKVQTVPGGRPSPPPPKVSIDCGPTGSANFQTTDPTNGNRARGVTACLNRGYLATHRGSGVPKDVKPPGYHWAKDFADKKGLPSDRNINACHLLGGQLGGSGSALENLSTCSRAANAIQRNSQQYKSNSMLDWENQVKSVIRDGDAQVKYSVTPEYSGSRTVPTDYLVTAYGAYPDGALAIAFTTIVPNILLTGENLGTQTDSGQPVPTGSTP